MPAGGLDSGALHNWPQGRPAGGRKVQSWPILRGRRSDAARYWGAAGPSGRAVPAQVGHVPQSSRRPAPQGGRAPAPVLHFRPGPAKPCAQPLRGPFQRHTPKNQIAGATCRRQFRRRGRSLEWSWRGAWPAGVLGVLVQQDARCLCACVCWQRHLRVPMWLPRLWATTRMRPRCRGPRRIL